MKLTKEQSIILGNLDEDVFFETLKSIERFNSLIWRDKNNHWDTIDWLLPSENKNIEGKCRTGDRYSHLIEKIKYNSLSKCEDFMFISSNETGVYLWDKNSFAWDYLFWRKQLLPNKKKDGSWEKKWKVAAYLNPGFAENITEEFLKAYQNNLLLRII